jgi:hypothetical protein
MHNFEYSKISKSTFSAEGSSQNLPKIHELFLSSLDKSIIVRIIPTEEFSKLPNSNLLKRDSMGRV